MAKMNFDAIAQTDAKTSDADPLEVGRRHRIEDERQDEGGDVDDSLLAGTAKTRAKTLLVIQHAARIKAVEKAIAVGIMRHQLDEAEHERGGRPAPIR